MRLLFAAAVAACAATQAQASTILLPPSVSTTFIGDIPTVDDVSNYSCDAVRDGAVIQNDMAPGSGQIGIMSGHFFTDDRRANFEFDLTGLPGNIKRAGFRFHAFAGFGDDGFFNCLFAYVGDGAASPGDFHPSRQAVEGFSLEFDTGTGGWWLDADIDLTSLVTGFQMADINFLGLQMIKGSHYDTVILISDARLVIDLPEPATLALFGLGALGLGMMRLRRR